MSFGTGGTSTGNKKRRSDDPALVLPEEVNRPDGRYVQTFLRWHYPGQVQRSVTEILVTLSARLPEPPSLPRSDELLSRIEAG